MADPEQMHFRRNLIFIDGVFNMVFKILDVRFGGRKFWSIA